jgi:hypothetical protein
MFGRIGFGLHSALAAKIWKVAHLPRPLEECMANEWQLTPDALDPSMLRRLAALGHFSPSPLPATSDRLGCAP